uniref:Uncharacterized protein n=1 Tax=Burkholderia cepacia TaxID=292 RepID=Q93L11_BURCE|nr:unknown [Burkholderia cepacia]
MSFGSFATSLQQPRSSRGGEVAVETLRIDVAHRIQRLHRHIVPPQVRGIVLVVAARRQHEVQRGDAVPFRRVMPGDAGTHRDVAQAAPVLAGAGNVDLEIKQRQDGVGHEIAAEQLLGRGPYDARCRGAHVQAEGRQRHPRALVVAQTIARIGRGVLQHIQARRRHGTGQEALHPERVGRAAALGGNASVCNAARLSAARPPLRLRFMSLSFCRGSNSSHWSMRQDTCPARTAWPSIRPSGKHRPEHAGSARFRRPARRGRAAGRRAVDDLQRRPRVGNAGQKLGEARRRTTQIAVGHRCGLGLALGLDQARHRHILAAQ